MTTRTRLRGHARIVAPIASALALTLPLGASSVAHAGFAITSPAAGAVVELDARAAWRIAFTASCPQGKTCGGMNSSSSSIVPNSVFFDLRHASYTSGSSADRFRDGLWYWEAADATIADSAAVVDDFAGNPSGRWTISTTWAECPLPTYPHETADNPCTRQQVERDVLIRAGAFEPFVALFGVIGKPKLAGTTISFYRNAPMASYRVKVAIQRQVRKRGRLRWATVASRVGQRFSKSTSNAAERHTNAFPKLALPRSISASTKLRARLTVTTVGVRPAMKPRTFTTKVKTRAALAQESASGGVVIGSR